MKSAVIYATAILVALAAWTVGARAQDTAQAPLLTVEGLQKLKQRALADKKTIVMPPGARIALRLQESNSRVECKQLVAGDLTRKYFFIVTTEKDTDDVFLSVQDGSGNVKMFLTNSKLALRNAASATRDTKLSPVLNVQAETEAFNSALAVWAQVAAGL